MEFKTNELLKTLIGHSDSITSICFSSDNSRLISGSKDNTIRNGI